MNVACPECRSVFRVDPAKVPAGGVRARCSVCGAVMSVEAPTTFGEESWTPGAAAAAAPPLAAHRPTTPEHEAASAAAPGAAHTPPPVTPAEMTPTMAQPATDGAATTAAPAFPAPPRYLAVAGSGMGTPVGSAFPASPRPLHTPVAPPVTPPAAPPVAMPSAARGTLLGQATGERAPINPFLANDPNQKAKRLARALVSDIVAYHPQQREQGLRDGTLRQLFKEEIKKSYEEYVEQVGSEFAETTGHFQEALNDILAGGRKMF